MSPFLSTSSAAGEKNVYSDTQTTDSECIPTRRKKQKTQLEKQQVLANELLLTVKEHIQKPRTIEDRFDVIGKSVAMKLRDLPKDQMLIAEKIIHETLFQAEIGNLTMSHKVTNETTQQSNFSPGTMVINSPETPSPIPAELKKRNAQYYIIQPSSSNVGQAKTISKFVKQ